VVAITSFSGSKIVSLLLLNLVLLFAGCFLDTVSAVLILTPILWTVAEYYLKSLLLGKDPFDVEALWECMYSATRQVGQQGLRSTP